MNVDIVFTVTLLKTDCCNVLLDSYMHMQIKSYLYIAVFIHVSIITYCGPIFFAVLFLRILTGCRQRNECLTRLPTIPSLLGYTPPSKQRAGMWKLAIMNMQWNGCTAGGMNY